MKRPTLSFAGLAGLLLLPVTGLAQNFAIDRFPIVGGGAQYGPRIPSDHYNANQQQALPAHPSVDSVLPLARFRSESNGSIYEAGIATILDALG